MIAQRPTVGRIVHFQSVTEGQYNAAIITKVHADGMTVDLTVFGPGEIRFATEVAFDGSYVHPGTWCWPERK